jgi:hypothetical protein
MKNEKAIIIQCFVRQVQAKSRTQSLRAIKKAKTKAFQEASLKKVKF